MCSNVVSLFNLHVQWSLMVQYIILPANPETKRFNYSTDPQPATYFPYISEFHYCENRHKVSIQ